MKSKRVLWLAHRIELLRQARDHLIACGIPAKHVGILSGAEKENIDARVLVASVDIFRTRTVPKVALIVVDEAHHVAAESYANIIYAAPGAQVLGLTATPERLDGKPLDDFKHLHIVAEAVELVAENHLLKSVVYGIPIEKAKALVTGANGGGKDYSRKKLSQAMRKRPLMADIVKERERLARGQLTIVYACSREHGRDILKRFEAAGVPSAYVDALTPATEREELLGSNGRLARREVQVVVNVGVLVEGFDCPPVSCIIVARPTKSLTLWRQMCGRGARYQKGKRYLVLDHAGNTWRHGFPDDFVEWSLEGREKVPGPTPVKICGECEAMNPVAAKECVECGHVFPATERELAEQKAELERIRARDEQKKRTLEVLRKLADMRGLGEVWVQEAMKKAG
jgi:superfamily II DNA or RNA helicase